MPVILPKTVWPHWLGEQEMRPEAPVELPVLYDGHLAMWPVHKDVGNVRNNGPDPDRADRRGMRCHLPKRDAV